MSSSDNSMDFIPDADDDSSAEYVTSLPSGVLSVHTKLLRDIDMNHIAVSVTNPELYVRVRVGSFIKSTVTVMVEKDDKIVLDDLKHFSLKVARKRSDPSNVVRFDLVVVESPHIHRVVGHKDMHLYDIIKSLYVAGSHDLQYRHDIIGVVELEMCFTYGTFGYGCCHQLQNRQKKISDIVSHSLVVRVEPPESRCQPNTGHVITAIPIGHPKFINFSVKSDIGSSDGGFGAPSTSDVFTEMKMLEPIVLIRTMRKRLNRIQTDFSQLGSRVQRKRFLERLILSHIHDHQAIDTDSNGPQYGEARAGSSARRGRIGEETEEEVQVNVETYGTDSDYADSTTDLNELMSSILMNAPGLVNRAITRRMQPSLLSIGEETSNTDLAYSESQLPHPEVNTQAKTIDPSALISSTIEVVRDRRRSTLTELPGLFVRSFANRITSWRSTINRPVQNQRQTPTVVTEGPVSQAPRGSLFSMPRFRSRVAQNDEDQKLDT